MQRSTGPFRDRPEAYRDRPSTPATYLRAGAKSTEKRRAATFPEAVRIAQTVSSQQPASAPQLDTLATLADFLGASRSTVERLVADGLPHLDIAHARPGRRLKRNLRFIRSEVVAYLKARRP